jgi:hypothetical protein
MAKNTIMDNAFIIVFIIGIVIVAVAFGMGVNSAGQLFAVKHPGGTTPASDSPIPPTPTDIADIFPENSFWIVYQQAASTYNLRVATNVDKNGNCGYDSSGKLKGNWQCDIITKVTKSWDGRTFGIALDSKNTPHISYYMEEVPPGHAVEFGDLGYTTPIQPGTGNCGPNNDWQCDRIDYQQNRLVGEYSSIAFDNNDKPYIAYSIRGPPGTYYALKIATPQVNGNCGYDYSGNFIGNWQCDEIDSKNWVGRFNSIAIDNTGTLHISYWNGNNGDVLYAKSVNSGGNCGNSKWQCSKVDIEGNVGLEGGPRSMDVDSQGTVYISSNRGSCPGQGPYERCLRVSKYVGSGGNCGYDKSGIFVGDWQCETIDDDVFSGRYSSLVIDKNDVPHVFYHHHDTVEAFLRHAYYVGGGLGNCIPNKDWKCEDIIHQTGTYNAADIYLNKYLVSPYSTYVGILGYAIKGPSNKWETQIIEQTGQGSHSLAAVK